MLKCPMLRCANKKFDPLSYPMRHSCMKFHVKIALAVSGLALCCGKAGMKEIPLLNKLKPANQYFHIDPAGKSIIKAEKGSIFTIEPDTFVLPDNFHKEDKVEIQLIEVT